MNTWTKPEFEEISLAMEVTAYVNAGKQAEITALLVRTGKSMQCMKQGATMCS